MADTPGKPVVQKLGLRPGFRIFVAGAPANYISLVGPLPPGVTIVPRLAGGVDMVHVFVSEASGLVKRLPAFKTAIEPDGMLWVSWPKKAAKLVTDLSDQVVRELALPLGLVDVKVCAIDATWSGLKFMVRRKLR